MATDAIGPDGDEMPAKASYDSIRRCLLSVECVFSGPQGGLTFCEGNFDKKASG